MTKRKEGKPRRPVLASPEREKIMRQWWETDKQIIQIVILCNEHPGTVVDTKNIRKYAESLNLYRRNVPPSITPPAPLSKTPSAMPVGIEEIPLEDALDWAQRVRLDLTGDDEMDVAAIKKARTAYGLPAWDIIMRRNIPKQKFTTARLTPYHVGESR